MLNNYRKLVVPTVALFALVILSFANSATNKAHAVDYIKKPSETHHQSFEPYENPIHIPDPRPKGITVRVKEITTYEVVVDEEKVATNRVTMADLDLIELKDKKDVNFHQVDCYFYAKVKQTQSKSTEYISSTRWREGEQFWLSDGGKYVEWEPWSEWYSGSKW